VGSHCRIPTREIRARIAALRSSSVGSRTICGAGTGVGVNLGLENTYAPPAATRERSAMRMKIILSVK
jgi:hypothetical protein